MKTFAVRTSVVLASVLMLSLWVAPAKDGTRAGGGSAGPSNRHSGPSPRGDAGDATRTASPRGSSVGHTTKPETTAYQPNLRGTSFRTFSSYYIWNDYYSYLSTHFNVNPLYFDRFNHNAEPLITPAMLKLTLREPIRLSSELLDSIDQLQEMLASGPSGTPANGQALAEKSKHIRDLAKQIRRNQTLSHFDIRKERNLYSQSENSTLSREAMQNLREMATDLDHQLRDMYRQSSTSTVSVDSYKQPSLESLTKGIEKICKVIETRSKKL